MPGPIIILIKPHFSLFPLSGKQAQGASKHTQTNKALRSDSLQLVIPRVKQWGRQTALRLKHSAEHLTFPLAHFVGPDVVSQGRMMKRESGAFKNLRFSLELLK